MLQTKKAYKTITIIGGGAAGMMAAIVAGRAIGGDQVRIVEKNAHIGRKLLATGNGRCNFTNLYCTEWDLLDSTKGEASSLFVAKCFEQFDVRQTLDFFQMIGLLARKEDGGRLYPYAEQASSVKAILEGELNRLKIDLRCACTIKEIRPSETGDGFVLTEENGAVFSSQLVVLAVGGKAGIQYGNTGDGFRMAEQLGHTVRKPVPALVPFLTKQGECKGLKGIRAKGRVTLWKDQQGSVVSQTGEIQFHEEALSGICILNLSRFFRWENRPQELEDFRIKIDLFPEHDRGELLLLLKARVSQLKDQPRGAFLIGMLHERLGTFLLAKAGIPDTGKVGELQEEDLQELIKVLKSWEIRLIGTKGWKDAQVTCGGIAIEEIEAETMKSKCVPGLYFAGEVVDIDGMCGGYNLQWAWTSGFTAGSAAAKACKTNKYQENLC